MISVSSILEAILSKLFATLNAIPADKVAHFASGVILYALVMPALGAWIALLIVAIVALIKEGYDYANRDIHTPDIWDAVATTLGGLLGLFISFV